MPVRVLPTDRIRHHIDELFADGRSLPEILEEICDWFREKWETVEPIFR